MDGTGTASASKLAPALNDEPAGDDLLGYQPYARALSEIIAHPKLGTPFTVGVFGPWGAGKSSFMVQIRRHLVELGQPFVFFQPWVFDQRQEVWKALILSVVQYLQTIAPKAWADEAGDKLEALAFGVARLTVNKLLNTSGLGGDVTRLEDEIRRTSNEATTYVNTFRRGFEENKNAVLKAVLQQAEADRAEAAKHIKSDKRLFVFIDDLDRCTPEGCVMVLEAVKLFFGTEGCVFILGIDAEIVQRGIELKYRENPKVRGRDYLEKLIQLPFTLPPVSESTYQSYVQKVAADFGFSKVSVDLIAKASEGNPRRVKRLINCMHLIRAAARAIAERKSDAQLDEDKLALLLILQAQFPTVYSYLTREPLIYPSIPNVAWDVIRANLTPLLKAIDGDGAEKSADRFREFWQAAHSAGVPVFTDSDDLVRHLRISGLVESGDPTKVARLTELLDSQFAEGVQPLRGVVIDAPRVDSAARLRTEVDAFKNDWTELWASRPSAKELFFPKKRLLRVREMLNRRDQLLQEAKRGYGEDVGQQEVILRALGPRQAAQQLRKVTTLVGVLCLASIVAWGALLWLRYPSFGELDDVELKAIAADVDDYAKVAGDNVELRLKAEALRRVIEDLRLPVPLARDALRTQRQKVAALHSARPVDLDDPKDVVKTLSAHIDYDLSTLLTTAPTQPPADVQLSDPEGPGDIELLQDCLDEVPSLENKAAAVLAARESMLDAMKTMASRVAARADRAALFRDSLEILDKVPSSIPEVPRQMSTGRYEATARGVKTFVKRWLPDDREIPDLSNLSQADTAKVTNEVARFRTRSENTRKANAKASRTFNAAIRWNYGLLLPAVLAFLYYRWTRIAEDLERPTTR